MGNDLNDERLDSLFAAARKVEHNGFDIEYGFETRLMANIRAERERQSFFFWMWRLIPVFMSLAICLGIWIESSRYNSMIDMSTLTQVGNEETTMVAFLTGE
jgi:hypothetical protein